MQYAQFQQILDEAGLSLREFALLLKLNPNSLTNYKKRGTVPSHLAVIANLVRELAFHGLDYRSAVNRAGIAPKAPRGSSGKAFARTSSGTT
jgi:hypothetical protein